MTEHSLSISIPTHHGRAPLLAEALSSIAGQTGSVPGWDLEVCESDNASHDGTEEVVRAFERESGMPVTYCRNEHDLGLGANILQAVELASGHWCWPVGSDDHLAGDALLTMIRLLEAHPDATGVTQPRENFTADMSHRLEPDRPDFYPLGPEPSITCSPRSAGNSRGFQTRWRSASPTTRHATGPKRWCSDTPRRWAAGSATGAMSST